MISSLCLSMILSENRFPFFRIMLQAGGKETGVVSRKLIAGALILAVPIALCVTFRPDRAIRVATGVVAHNVCSKTFVSGLDPQTVFAETIDRAGIRRLRWGLTYHLDRSGQTVEASLAGGVRSRAAFHDAVGGGPLLRGTGPPLLQSHTAGVWRGKNPPRPAGNCTPQPGR